MNQRPTLLKPLGPGSLADENDFQLGDMLIRPSLGEVNLVFADHGTKIIFGDHQVYRPPRMRPSVSSNVS